MEGWESFFRVCLTGGVSALEFAGARSHRYKFEIFDKTNQPVFYEIISPAELYKLKDKKSKVIALSTKLASRPLPEDEYVNLGDWSLELTKEQSALHLPGANFGEKPAASPIQSLKDRSYAGSSAEVGSIISISSDGEVIKLNDGTSWLVNEIDRIDSRLWLVGDEVVLVNEEKLIHTDDNESVEVSPIR